MKEYLTRKNIGLALALLYAVPITMGAIGKLASGEQTLIMLSYNNIEEWMMIIGIGEIISLILFLIPKTMRLGAMLLAAYFGGAIMFHMAHPIDEHTGFLAPSIYLTILLVISWIRGLNLIEPKKE